MCIGIPAQVVSPQGAMAWCADREGLKLVDLSLVGPQPQGAWLLTFLGAAREVITQEAAHRIDAAIDALASVMRGDPSGVHAAFGDLIERTPQLPEHLRRKES